MTRTQLLAPFPWFGGKSRVAHLVWERFGADIRNYVEPFFGSGAVWLSRPDGVNPTSCVNDLDGNIANFWRAVRQYPDAVAEAADWPVNECDLHARHLWLIDRLPRLADRLMADPRYCNPVAAGWWAWGCCAWIGSGWCSGDGPWRAEPDADGIPVLTKGDAGRGINRQLPHIGDAGQGINRQLPPSAQDRSAFIRDWMQRLADSMRETRVACGDWQRICSPGSMTRLGTCGVLLDPPYSQTDAVYAHDSSTVAHDVRAWCVANGGNPKLRIALCGHAGEHDDLAAHGWTVTNWRSKGYQGADDRERIWFSPACLPAAEPQPMELAL